MSKLNDRYAVLLAVLTLLSAVPVASARPSWWLLWAMVIAVLGLYWLWQATRLAPHRMMQSHRYARYLMVAAIVPLYAVLQALPLPSFLPSPALREGVSGFAPPAISMLPSASWIGALRFGTWIILFILVVEIATNRKRILTMSWIIFVGITLQALWSLVALRILGDVSLFGDKQAYNGSATGTFVNRNSLATYLGFGLLVGAGLLSRRLGELQIRQSRVPSLPERLGSTGFLILSAMLIIAVALIFTQSRLGIIATGIAFFITSAMLLKRNGKLTPRTFGLMVVLGLLAVAAVLFIGRDGLSERLIFLEKDGDSRLAIYKNVLQMIATRPFAGWGFDAFEPAFETFRSPPLNSQFFYQLAHSSYLGLWSEMGVVIGSIPMVLLAIAAVKIYRRLDREESFPVAGTITIGCLVLGAIHSIGDFSLEIPANVFLLVLILGMGLGSRQKRVSSEEKAVATTPIMPSETVPMQRETL